MDFTALGDAVNVGARLQSHALAGEVVLASDLYSLVAADYPGGRSEQLEVRGREKPLRRRGSNCVTRFAGPRMPG